MLERFSRSWTLFKASASVLMQDRELLLFPLVSLAALVVLVASFALPAIGLAFAGGFSANRPGFASPAVYALAFLFYFGQYFVVLYFNAALVGAALVRLDGGSPTFVDGLRIASSRVSAIAGYAAMAATAGLILRAIQERVGFVGRIIVGMLGVAWSVATYLVVPILVADAVGPIDALRKSAGLIRKTWGENVVGQVGLGAIFSLVFVGVVGVGFLLLTVAILAQSVPAIVAALVATVLLLGITGLVHSALSGVYAAALYRYAATGEGAPGFDSQALRLAFAPK
jgi:Family of unknown function (DUF6159)